MKICLVSFLGTTESQFEKCDGLPDPIQCIPRHRHEFVNRKITGSNAKSEIDEVCREDFDIFMNCMGVDRDGIEAAKYLESKGVTILTNPSSLLATNNLDVKQKMNELNLKVPGNTYGKYPKMIKYFDKCGSLWLDENSVCSDDESVRKRIILLQEENPTLGISAQDYIFGDDCAVVVIDLGTHVVALIPLQFGFPDSTSADAEFLTRDDRIAFSASRDINHILVEGELQERLQQTAINAFTAIKSSSEGAWAYVTMRVERSSEDIYVINVHCNPLLFDCEGHRFNGDFLVEATFPGGREAFLDTLLTVKRSQLGSNKCRIQKTAAVYDSWSDTYDEFWESTNMSKMQQFTADNFDFSGSVLDLACGTGVFGRILHDRGAMTTEIVGVEISAGMLCAPDIKKYYKKPLWNCSMQEYIMENAQFDHIVCFGALLFLDAVELNTVLARMFMMARKSLTIEVENLENNVITKMQEDIGDLFFMNNHVQMVERFGVPNGWRLVHKQHGALYPSPASEGNVEGYIVRFERLIR